MKKLTHEQVKLLKKIGIIVLAALCLGALVWFIILSRQLVTSGDLQSDYVVSPHVRIHHIHPVVSVNDIMPWMTFNYLNVVFKLPPAFLKNALAITDTHYPNIRIDSYIKAHTLDQTLFMQSVQQAISSYTLPK